MSEELLSAMLDGECTPAEVEAVLAAIERSPALAARWSRMCATRDALAGVAVIKPSRDFAAGVMAALDDEPAAVPNPKVVQLRARPVAASPAPVAVPAAAVSARSLRWQRFAGLAVAASITAVVAVGGRSLLDRPIAGDVAGNAVEVASLEGQGNPNLVRISANGEVSGSAGGDGYGSADLDQARSAQLDEETASNLTHYIIQHINSPARAGMGGALGYTRIVAQPGSYPAANGSR